MAVAEYQAPERRPDDAAGELAHQKIDIRNTLDRAYLRTAVTDLNGDAADAWKNFRRIGEIRYGISRNARIAGYTKFVAVRVDPKGDITDTRDTGVVAEIVNGITSRFGGTRGLVERYYALTKIPGQMFPIKVRENIDGEGALDGYWFLSASELAREGQIDVDRKAKRNEPLTWITKRRGSGDDDSAIRKIRREDFLGRIWVPDFEYTEEASSPLQSVAMMCEQLHELTETISARLRQRFALAGILLIPTEINDAAISGDKPRDGLFSTDKVMNYLIHLMTTNVVRHSQGMAEMPILLKGPAAVLDQVRHLVQDHTIADTDLKLRAELIGRILTALDQQKSAVEGMEGQNHWGAWMVSDEERRISVQPDIERLCFVLTRTVLWPELKERGWTAGRIAPWRVWFDLSAASVRSNLSEDARQGVDRLAVGLPFLRRTMGATEEDAPSGDEMVRQVGTLFKNPVLALHGLEGVDVDWDRAAAWGKSPGPTADSPADDPEAGPGVGDPGSPDDRDSDTPKTEEPG